MVRNSLVLISTAFCVVLVGCGPSPEQVAASNTAIAATVVAQMTADAPTATSTSTSTPIPTATRTPRPTATSTPRPSPTVRPSPTPGAFSNPAPSGPTIKLRDAPLGNIEMACTLLEVRRDAEADDVARSLLSSYMYQDPIEGQERIAVRARLEVLRADLNEVFPLYADWHLSLRHEPTGRDVFPENMGDTWAEGYPPLEGEGWMTFLVRKGSSPLLYFQPNRAVTEVIGYRDQGAFFSLTNDS